MKTPTRIAVVTLASMIAAATPAAPALGAKSVTCEPQKYGTYETGIPRVSRLRATGLPRLTSGYAPRCLVADTAASRLVTRPYDLPRTIKLYGARWNAGRWTISSRFDSERFFTSVRLVRGNRRITFRFTEPRD